MFLFQVMHRNTCKTKLAYLSNYPLANDGTTLRPHKCDMMTFDKMLFLKHYEYSVQWTLTLKRLFRGKLRFTNCFEKLK